MRELAETTYACVNKRVIHWPVGNYASERSATVLAREFPALLSRSLFIIAHMTSDGREDARILMCHPHSTSQSLLKIIGNYSMLSLLGVFLCFGSPVIFDGHKFNGSRGIINKI